MKKIDYIILFVVGIGIILIGIILFASQFIEISTNYSRAIDWCKENNISKCSVRTPECFYDCKSLNLEYFKLNTNAGFFQGAECYCKLNGMPKKIW